MTGTALTEEAEFGKIYNLGGLLQYPQISQMLERDLPDVVYKTEKQKYIEVVNEIEKINKEGQTGSCRHYKH
ncbi:MAG: hypothetical protein MZU97_06160 [Bacillus subtilis]|nr:hypothetical protein [Bacillus subtilis]